MHEIHSSEPRKLTDWDLSSRRLKRLLRALDEDPDRAAQKLKRLQEKLTTYVLHRSRCDPATAVWTIIDRLTAKLEEKPIESAAITSYALRIAHFVILEENRRIRKENTVVLLADLDAILSYKQSGRDYECLEWAFGSIARHKAELLEDYYPAETPATGLPEHRRLIAERLEISEDALQHRIAEYKQQLCGLFQLCCEKKVT